MDFFRMCLASADRRSEDVCVIAVIVAELELSDVQMQVFLADLVESAHYAALAPLLTDSCRNSQFLLMGTTLSAGGAGATSSSPTRAIASEWSPMCLE
jgi:hypothetical protein